MVERLSSKSMRVMTLAQEEARRLGHSFVDTEQILLGLIAESTGVIADLCRSKDITLEDARIEVEKIIGRGSEPVPEDIPLTPQAERVLELSLAEAEQLNSEIVEPEHLLLGLVTEEEGVDKGVAIRVLENLGYDLGEIRTSILNSLNGQVNQDNPVNRGDRFDYCSVGDCGVNYCSVGDCGVGDCGVGDCNSADCSGADCSGADCSGCGDCSGADCGSCFIATAVYGSYDAPQVITLRYFRDKKLMPHRVGRLFVATYYQLSPPLAKGLKTSPFFAAPVRYILNKFVAWLEK
jgi:hypothetical protein